MVEDYHKPPTYPPKEEVEERHHHNPPFTYYLHLGDQLLWENESPKEQSTRNDPVGPLPAKPKPPACRLIREGDTGPLCSQCGSSLEKVFTFFRTEYCIQPQCPNYWYHGDNITSWKDIGSVIKCFILDGLVWSWAAYVFVFETTPKTPAQCEHPAWDKIYVKNGFYCRCVNYPNCDKVLNGRQIFRPDGGENV